MSRLKLKSKIETKVCMLIYSNVVRSINMSQPYHKHFLLPSYKTFPVFDRPSFYRYFADKFNEYKF